MPSPYFRSDPRAVGGAAGTVGVDLYYRHAGDPTHYVFDWTGMPEPGFRAVATKALGDALDLDMDCTARTRLRKSIDLGAVPTWPVRQSAFTGRRSVRHSGPEQGALAGLSRMETTAVKLGVLAAAGYVVWRLVGGKKR